MDAATALRRSVAFGYRLLSRHSVTGHRLGRGFAMAVLLSALVIPGVTGCDSPDGDDPGSDGEAQTAAPAPPALDACSSAPSDAPSAGAPAGAIGDATPTFAWRAVSRAESYTLYVLRVGDEAVVLRQTGIRDTSFTPASPLPTGVELRWKVKGESACGPGPYSPSLYFSVTASTPSQLAPVPGGPSGTISDATPTFTWSAVPGAESYTLYVLRVSDEAVVLRQIGVRETSFTPAAPLPTGVDLRWKVKGESAYGTGPYSPSVYFRILASPACPPTAAPVPGGAFGAISDATPTFAWSEVPGAESYTLYVLRVSDEVVVLRQVDIRETSFVPASPLPTAVALRWKVKGESRCGPGPYSPSVYFTVQPATPRAEISVPKQGATVAEIVTVQAVAAANVTRVEFYVDGALQSTDASAPFEFVWDTAANPLPASTHPMDFGYYFVEWKNTADFDAARAEVNGHTNLYYASRSSYVSELTPSQWLALLAQSLANASKENRRIQLALGINTPEGEAVLDSVLAVAAPHWDRVVRLELADEPAWDRATTETKIRTVTSKLAARGLGLRPMGVVYVYNQPLPDAVNAPNLDWVGIEAYLNFPGSPSSQVNIDTLSTYLEGTKAQVPAGKDIVLVMMAYDRNGQWTNIETLRDLQVPTYLHAYNDPRVVAINMFAYTRAGGSRDHPQLRVPHRLIGEKTLGTAIAGAGNGPRTLSIKAYDAGGNSSTDRVSVVVANAL
jgi:hypothetical protein